MFGTGQLTKAEMLAIVKEQALNKQKKKEQPSRSFSEQVKFYATFSFSLIAITGFSVLMFLGIKSLFLRHSVKYLILNI